MARRDYRHELASPEQAAQNARNAAQRLGRKGAIAWFNLRQKHAAGVQPSAMRAAFAAARGKA